LVDRTSAERSEAVHRTRGSEATAASGLFHPCFCREWYPQGAERPRIPEREKDGFAHEVNGRFDPVDSEASSL